MTPTTLDLARQITDLHTAMQWDLVLLIAVNTVGILMLMWLIDGRR